MSIASGEDFCRNRCEPQTQRINFSGINIKDPIIIYRTQLNCKFEAIRFLRDHTMSIARGKDVCRNKCEPKTQLIYVSGININDPIIMYHTYISEKRDPKMPR